MSYNKIQHTAKEAMQVLKESQEFQGCTKYLYVNLYFAKGAQNKRVLFRSNKKIII